MQKLFNFMSLTSFLMSASMFGGTLLLYSRVPGMVTDYVDSITDDVTEQVTEVIPEKLEQALPKLPKTTGPAIPFP